METVEVLIAVASLLLTYLLVKWYRDPLRKIPGPPSPPFLGNAADLRPNRLHQSLQTWNKKYGPVVKFQIFAKPAVLISSAELAVEALMKKGSDFAGRPYQPRIIDLGIMSPEEDPKFVKSRKVINLALKAYGPGMRHLEDMTVATLNDLVKALKAKNGEPIETDVCSSGFAISSLCSLFLGKKYHFEDPIVQQINKMNDDIMSNITPFSRAVVFDVLPFLRKYKFFFPKTQKSLDDAKKSVDDFLVQQYEEALTSFDPDNAKSIINHLIAMQKSGAEGVTEQRVKVTIGALFLAGVDTSRIVSNQMFLNLLHNPDVVKKIQEQIAQNFEPSHVIGYSDRQSLPYVEAFVLEAIRYGCLAPYLLPHAALEDSEVGGYKIPQGTLLMINAFQIMHNPDVYPEPYKLKPERFLDENGQMLPVDHPVRAHMLQFGLGKRRCPGELFAKSRQFAFITNILKEFDIEAAEPVPDDRPNHYELSDVAGVHVKSVKVRFISRVKQ